MPLGLQPKTNWGKQKTARSCRGTQSNSPLNKGFQRKRPTPGRVHDTSGTGRGWHADTVTASLGLLMKLDSTIIKLFMESLFLAAGNIPVKSFCGFSDPTRSFSMIPHSMPEVGI